MVTACATVKVRKVPSPTQYIRWTDAQQEKADKMEGIRFYLPRPFVSVFESFPIRTDIYLANGVVSPDGKYVVVTSVTTESGLSKYLAMPNEKVEIPDAYISKGRIKAHAGDAVTDAVKDLVLGDIGNIIETGVVGGLDPAPKSPPPPPPPAPQARTGIGQRTSTNDNGAFAYQPLRGNFDLVYLPDFEEQFVVSESAGLGNAMFEINLGQGWSLQGFNSLTDNSELNRRIYDLIDTAMRMAKTAASGALGIPPLPDAPGVGGLLKPHAGQEEKFDKLVGTPVTLKIVVVHYAAKGLYPVIKPRELQERTLDPGDSFGILDLFKLFPKVQMSSNFDPTAITRSQRAIDNQTGSYTVPRYPYQYISFNTFRYMAIEVVRPTADDTSPFQHLYDKTGTQGDVGDARRGELVDLFKQLQKFFDSQAHRRKNGANDETPLPTAFDKLKGAIGTSLKSKLKDKVAGFEVEKVELALVESNKTVTPTVKLSKRGTDEDKLKSEVKKALDEVLGKTKQLKSFGLKSGEPTLTGGAPGTPATGGGTAGTPATGGSTGGGAEGNQ